MNDAKKMLLTASNGQTLAELLISEEEEGWFLGEVVRQSFPFELKKALAWYAEVVHDQMLSYLDEAVRTVEKFAIHVKFPDGSIHRIYSLYVSPSNEVSFRITAVSLPPELPNTAIS